MGESGANKPGAAGGAEDARLDAYLDGLLDGAERADFERAMMRNPEIREEVDLHRAIEDSLRRTMARDGGRAGEVRAASPRWAHRGVRWYAAAAAITVVGATVLWFAASRLIETEVEGVYRRTLAAGFTPQFACTTDEQFRTWVWSNFQQSVQPAADHAGVEFVGWTYSQSLGPYTALLLARVGGEEVVVFMQRVERMAGNEPTGPILSGLNMHRRDVGKLRFYEVSPLGRAAVLDVLREIPPPTP